MTIRSRVALALVVAAVVPLLGVFTLIGVALPTIERDAEERRLGQVATSTSSLLRRECTAVNDRAALVVARLQTEVSLADVTTLPVAALREAAPRVVEAAVVDGDPWTVGVVLPDGTEQVTGDTVPGVAADPSAYVGLQCREGDLRAADGTAVVAASLPVEVAGREEPLAQVVVVAPLDESTLDRLTTAAGLSDTSLLVLADSGAVASSSGLSGSPAVVDGVATTAVADDDASGRYRDRVYVSSEPVLGGAVRVVAVAQATPLVDRSLVIAFAVAAFGTALLVWLLSSTFTRPLTDLAELARRIAEGDDDGSEPVEVSGDSQLRGVSDVLGTLARDLRAREADAQRRQGNFLDAFNRFGDALQQTHDRDGLLQTVLQAALLAAEAPMGLALHHDRGGRLGRRVLSLRERSRAEGPTELDEVVRTRLARLADMAMAEQVELYEEGDGTLGPVLAVPLGTESRPLGAVVVARDPGEPPYDEIALEAIHALASNAGTALVNIKDHLEVERLSVTDPLTGVHNFRHLSTMLAREVERASRFGHPLGVLMVDLDRFKAVNDSYGHPAGDAVLRELARRMSECVREVDTVARYGGEEFALLLPETDLDGATALAGRILVSLREEPFRLPDGGAIDVTASVGIAAYPDHGSTGAEVVRAADGALYTAKAQGRDRAVVAPLPRAGHLDGAPPPVAPPGPSGGPPGPHAGESQPVAP